MTKQQREITRNERETHANTERVKLKRTIEPKRENVKQRKKARSTTRLQNNKIRQRKVRAVETLSEAPEKNASHTTGACVNSSKEGGGLQGPAGPPRYRPRRSHDPPRSPELCAKSPRKAPIRRHTDRKRPHEYPKDIGFV